MKTYQIMGLPSSVRVQSDSLFQLGGRPVIRSAARLRRFRLFTTDMIDASFAVGRRVHYGERSDRSPAAPEVAATMNEGRTGRCRVGIDRSVRIMKSSGARRASRGWSGRAAVAWSRAAARVRRLRMLAGTRANVSAKSS